jgi:mRNA-degrading endonuclease RelE of RelBE toxin-antitoxin system
VPRYQLRYEAAYLDDLRSLQRAYDLPLVTQAVLALADQAEALTRNRRPLAAPISWCPTATWQQRVQDYRVLYRVENGVVLVLRVRFKGSKATEEMGP